METLATLECTTCGHLIGEHIGAGLYRACGRLGCPCAKARLQQVDQVAARTIVAWAEAQKPATLAAWGLNEPALTGRAEKT